MEATKLLFRGLYRLDRDNGKENGSYDLAFHKGYIGSMAKESGSDYSGFRNQIRVHPCSDIRGHLSEQVQEYSGFVGTTMYPGPRPSIYPPSTLN